jgi:NTP pyrophosphatase (non-canonical NTP hydrolase)
MTAQPEEVPGTAGGRVTDLEALAAALSRHLEANRRPGVTARMAFDASLLKVIEEAGELAGAHSRFRGTSRRLGTIEDLEGELADVVLSAAVYAVQAGAGAGLHRAHQDPYPAAAGTFTGETADAALIALTCTLYRLAEAHGSLPAPPGRASQACLADVARLTGESLAAARAYAACAGIDLDAAVTRKVTRILARGWREEQAPR